MKRYWKEWLYFSPKERNAAIVLVIVVGLIFLLPAMYKVDDKPVGIKDSIVSQIQQTNGPLISAKPNIDSFAVSSEAETRAYHLTFFDPNTATQPMLESLGIPARVALTMIHYREKGGRFRYPSDLKKIYTLNASLADKLIPYVRIENVIGERTISLDRTKNGYAVQNNKTNNLASSNVYSKKSYKALDVNLASESEWASLPGIGEVLSKRIVKFRKYKNGFASVDDVANTYGLSAETFEKIKPYLRVEKEYVEVK